MGMLSYLQRVRKSLKRGRPAQRHKSRRPRQLQLETLEDRTLLSIMFNPQFGVETQIQDNGAALQSPPVYLIFWGSFWGGTNSPAANAIKTAAANVLSSPYLSGLNPQYHSDGLSHLDPVSAQDGSNPADLGFDGSNIDDVIQNQIDHGPLPESDTPARTPIYVVVTPPGIQSSDGRNVVGFNGLGHDLDVTAIDVDFDDIPEVWSWTGNNSDGTININQFSLTFSHEVAEIMSDLGGGGFEVNPGPQWTGGGTGNQIGDYEGNSYFWRQPNGTMVQPYWSNSDSRWLVPDGNSQAFYLNPIWNSSGQYTGQNTLDIVGDQLANHNDTITIDTTPAGGVKVTLNGETASFDPGQIFDPAQIAAIRVHTGGGNDTVNVLRTISGVPVTIDSTGSATVNVGNNGSMQEIRGTVSITNGPSFTQVELNDFNDPGVRTPTFDNFTPAGDTPFVRITGLAPATIASRCADTRDLIVRTGTGAVTATVLSNRPTGGVMTLEGHSANTQINVGNNGSMQDIQGTLIVTNAARILDPNNVTQVELNDFNDPGARTPTFDTFTPAGDTPFVRITGLAPATILSRGLDTRDVIVRTGTGAVTATVLSNCPMGGVMTLEGHSANTQVNVGNNGSVQDIRDTLIVTNAARILDPNNVTQVELNDFNDPGARTPTFDTFTPAGDTPFVRITGLAPATIFSRGLDTRDVIVRTGTGTVTATVLSNCPMAGVMTLEGHSANTQINVGNNGSVQEIRDTLIVTNAARILNPNNVTQVELNDFNDPGVRTPTFDNFTPPGDTPFVRINGLAPATIFSRGLDTRDVIVRTGTGVITATVLSTCPMAGIMTLEGHSANNTVNVGNAGSAQGIFGAVTIFNSPSRDQVNIDDSADNGNRNVTISTSAVTGLAPAAINFTPFSVSTLSVLGGSGNNTYTISGGPVSNSVNLTAGVGNNTLIGPSGFAFWNINGNNLGQLDGFVNFFGVRNLTGASGNDSFIFADGAGVGGNISAIAGGANLLDYSAYSTPVTVDLSTNSATGVGGSVRNIGEVQGGSSHNSLTGNAAGNTLFFGSTGNDNITGLGTGNTLYIIDPNGASTTFRVTAQNSGTATTGASTTTFTGVQNLAGLSGADTYVFSDGAGVSGNIADDGAVAGGSNTLNYAAYTTTVVVDLQTHKGTGVGGSILDIQNVTGGNGGPAGTYNLLIGNGGNTLTGGTGRRNILVAGGAASTLIGGDQEDLLIAGFTQYDTEAALASWLQIATYWAGTDNYATRVDNLTGGNGVPRLDASTVTGNGGGNTLNGTGELAWIFSDGNDFGNNLFDPASRFVHIDP
jgi:hypothetical protein